MSESYTQLPLTAQTRRCTRCHEDKPLDAFGKERRGSAGLRSHCRACRSIERKQRYAENLDHERAVNTRWRRENPARMRALIARWNEKNPTRVGQWSRTHRDAKNASMHRRRARLEGNGGVYTESQWHALKSLYDHHCLCCGVCEPAARIEPDHVIPISRGGVNDITNIQPLCTTCNRAKWTRTVDYRRGSFAALILNRKREQFGYEQVAKSIAAVLRT